MDRRVREERNKIITTNTTRRAKRTKSERICCTTTDVVKRQSRGFDTSTVLTENIHAAGRIVASVSELLMCDFEVVFSSS